MWLVFPPALMPKTAWKACTSAWTHRHTHAQAHTSTQPHIHAHRRAHTYNNTHTHTHRHSQNTRAQSHTHMHTGTHVKRMCTHKRMHTQKSTRAHTHVCTHRHTQATFLLCPGFHSLGALQRSRSPLTSKQPNRLVTCSCWQGQGQAYSFFQSSPEDTPTDFRKRGKEGEKHQCEINRLPLACALIGNRTHNLLVYGAMFQPAEPPSQGETYANPLCFQ